MSKPQPQPPELLQLLWAMCDGTASVADLVQLEQWAANDSAIRRVYLQFVAMHTALQWTNRGDQATAEALAAFPTNVPTIRAPLPAVTTPTPVLGMVGRAIRGGSVVQLVATLVVAAAFYGVFGVLVWNLKPNGSRSATAGDYTVAVLTESNNAKWSAASTAPDDHRVKPGEQLSLASGQVTLELTRGARVKILAPAKWSVDDDNAVSVQQGKLFAKISPQATGFTVKTPTATVVDLGTEFSVFVSENQRRTDVEVLVGEVQVTTEAAAGASSVVTVRLKRGEARRFAAVGARGEVVSQPLPVGQQASPFHESSVNFPDSSNANASGSDTQTAFADLLLADQPSAVWCVSQGRNGIVRNVVSQDGHGRFVGRPRTPGEFDGVDDYVEFRNLVADDFSYEVWLKTSLPSKFDERPYYGRLVFRSGVPGVSSDYGVMLVDRSLYFYEGVPRVGVGKIGTAKIVDGEWHQVVLTRQRNKTEGLKLYVDGVLDASLDTADLELRINREAFIGGAPGIEPRRHFQGAIEALSLYDRALDAVTIERRYHIGKQLLKQ